MYYQKSTYVLFVFQFLLFFVGLSGIAEAHTKAIYGRASFAQLALSETSDSVLMVSELTELEAEFLDQNLRQLIRQRMEIMKEGESLVVIPSQAEPQIVASVRLMVETTPFPFYTSRQQHDISVKPERSYTLTVLTGTPVVSTLRFIGCDGRELEPDETNDDMVILTIKKTGPEEGRLFLPDMGRDGETTDNGSAGGGGSNQDDGKHDFKPGSGPEKESEIPVSVLNAMLSQIAGWIQSQYNGAATAFTVVNADRITLLITGSDGRQKLQHLSHDLIAELFPGVEGYELFFELLKGRVIRLYCYQRLDSCDLALDKKLLTKRIEAIYSFSDTVPGILQMQVKSGTGNSKYFNTGANTGISSGAHANYGSYSLTGSRTGRGDGGRDYIPAEKCPFCDKDLSGQDPLIKASHIKACAAKKERQEKQRVTAHTLVYKLETLQLRQKAAALPVREKARERELAESKAEGGLLVQKLIDNWQSIKDLASLKMFLKQLKRGGFISNALWSWYERETDKPSLSNSEKLEKVVDILYQQLLKLEQSGDQRKAAENFKAFIDILKEDLARRDLVKALLEQFIETGSYAESIMRAESDLVNSFKDGDGLFRFAIKLEGKHLLTMDEYRELTERHYTVDQEAWARVKGELITQYGMRAEETRKAVVEALKDEGGPLLGIARKL